MNRKTLIICSIVILASISFIVYRAIPKPQPKPPRSFTNDYEKSNYVKDFTSKEKGKERDIAKNESGYTGFTIKNKQSLLKTVDLDAMLSVNDNINNALTYINKSYPEVKKLENSKLEEYYTQNTDDISSKFGIDNYDKFKSFLNKLVFLEDSKINSVEIDENSITKENNILQFNLLLKTTANKEQTFKIKMILQQDNKNNRFIYWE